MAGESKLVFPEHWITHLEYLLGQDPNWGSPDGYYGAVARVCMEVYRHRFDGQCRFKTEDLDDIEGHIRRARAKHQFEWGGDDQTAITHQICRTILERARPRLFDV